MQSFFCLGSLFNIFFGKHSRSEPQWDEQQDGDWVHMKRRRRNNQRYVRKTGQTGGGIFCISRSRAHPPTPSSFRARMTCNYVWACPKSEVTQITPSFSRAVEMRETHRERGGGEEKERDNQPSLANPPNPSHNIKYHEIISVISMEICLQIINASSPPPLSVHNLFI